MCYDCDFGCAYVHLGFCYMILLKVSLFNGFEGFDYCCVRCSLGFEVGGFYIVCWVLVLFLVL